jgi:GDP-4-dehydro-6-deoxy-D-mannose reductase
VRVLVTGANGFLGRQLVAVLEEAGAAPVALALERGSLPERTPFLAVDVRDARALAAAVEETDPETIVHLAALSHVGDSWRRIDDYYAVNVVGTENVLAAARGRRVVFSSSAEVYGAVPEAEQPIPESRPPAPRSPYALTKAVAERAALAAGAVVVRCFNLLGPGQAAAFALPSFAGQLAAIARGERAGPLRVGNLCARRDFVHVRDAAEGFELLLRRGEPGGVYNLASGAAISIGEALDRLVAIAGLGARTEVDPERVRPVDVPLLAGDAARLRALGWRAGRGVDAALAELWAEVSGAPVVAK